MRTPLEVHSDNGIELPQILYDDLVQRVTKMEEHAGRDLIKCRVNIGTGASHHHRNGAFKVGIVVDAAGGEYAAQKENIELHVALREAAKAMLKQLETHHDKRTAKVKTHTLHAHATVSRLMEDHGFLVAPDGHELYFHRNSVIDASYDQLQVGEHVAFIEQPGDKGPQASTVRRAKGPPLPEDVRVPKT